MQLQPSLVASRPAETATISVTRAGHAPCGVHVYSRTHEYETTSTVQPRDQATPGEELLSRRPIRAVCELRRVTADPHPSRSMLDRFHHQGEVRARNNRAETILCAGNKCGTRCGACTGCAPSVRPSVRRVPCISIRHKSAAGEWRLGAVVTWLPVRMRAAVIMRPYAI